MPSVTHTCLWQPNKTQPKYDLKIRLGKNIGPVKKFKTFNKI